MATGKLPFAGASPSETVTNILEKPPLPLTKHAPDRPLQLERIVERLLAKQASDRFESARVLLTEFDTTASRRIPLKGFFDRVRRRRRQ